MARIEKKNYLLRHIIIIIMIIIILFPMIWVVSTSIRRDAAAFSPRLFSDRLTLNNYKDLIFQTPNVPEIMQNLNKVSTYISEYSDYSYDEAVKESKKELNRLEDYLKRTENNMSNIDSQFSEIYNVYDSGYKQDLIKEINNFIKNNDLKLLNEMVNNIHADAEQYNFSFPDNNLENKVNDFLSLRNNLYNEYQKLNLNDETQKEETLKAIYEIPVKTTLWKIRVQRKNPDNENIKAFGEKLNQLKEDYDSIEEDINSLKSQIQSSLSNSFESLMDQKNQYEINLSSIRNNISNLENNKSKLSSNIQNLDNKIKAVADIYLPERDKVNSSYKVIEKIDLSKVQPESPMFGDNVDFQDLVSEYARKLPEFVKNMESVDKYQDSEILGVIRNFGNIYQYLNENFTKIFALRDSKEVTPAFEAFKNLTMKMSISLDELVVLSEEYNKNMQQLNKVSEELNTSRDKEIKLNDEYLTFKQKNSKKIDFINELLSYPNLLVSKYFANSEINNLSESEYYANFMESDFFNGFKPELNRYRLLRWKASLDDAYARFEQSKTDMNSILEKIRQNMQIFENNLEDYLHLNYGGNISSIPSLSEMRDVYISDFGDINANIARSSRVISELSYVTNNSISGTMKKIDGELYSIQHLWEEMIRKPFLRWLFNSVLVAGLTAIFTVLVTSLAAYPFSRMKFVGRSTGLYFLMIVQMFPIIMFMVAIYGILNFLGDYLPFIGLDTLGGLIFAYMGNVAYNMWLFKGYYDTIPDSLEESAMIDGATRFQTFWLIVLPLSLPIIAVITILTFMNTFNEFVIAKIVLQSEINYTYAVGLQTFSQGPFETQWGMFTAASLIGAIPMVIIFLTMQKWIIGGLTQGSVKG